MNKRVPKERITLIKNNYMDLTDEQLAHMISAKEGKRVSISAIKKMRQRLGLRKTRGRG